MRAIFCGTPEIAVPSLDALAEVADVVAVVCQPDRPAGRGMKLRSSAVKLRALEMGITPFQPKSVRDGALSTWMKAQEADVALVIAYGRILGKDALEAPRLGCVNLHASLLPKYRGAAPIQRVIMAGDEETGVCLMKMDEGMDTGDVLACQSIPIAADETSGSLAIKLGELAAQLTRTELPNYCAGRLSPTPQTITDISFAAPITKNDCLLDFTRDSVVLARQVRALAPRPGASCMVNRIDIEQKKRLKILDAVVASSGLDLRMKLKAGEIARQGETLLIGTGSVPLVVLRAQLEGKKAQSALEILNGRGLVPTDFLG